MRERDVLEVITPVLSAAAPSDLHLDSFRVETTSGERFLQTSPEYPMKRLLAAHGCDCYQIAPVFRAGERGTRHNPEFTMLEWYRVGQDHQSLMQEVDALLQRLRSLGSTPVSPAVQSARLHDVQQEAQQTGRTTWRTSETRRCKDLVEAVLGADSCTLSRSEPFIDVTRVRAHFKAQGRSWPESIGDDADAAFDLLMDEFVLPTLPLDRVVFIRDWPPSQAALARIGRDTDGRDVAERFELYLGAIEIGNGYHELRDADEQQRRFAADQAARCQCGLPERPLDQNLLDALRHGLPDCAGIAIGLERLTMALCGTNRIDDVIAFPAERA